jgi:hypothetical protein
MWGCGSVKTEGADVEAVFARMIDIISSATEIVMKLVLYIHRAEHSDTLANYYSFLASTFELQIYEHSNII